MSTKSIGYMAAAQEDDGYLYTAWTARDKIDNPANIICCYPKKQKWVEEEMSHELYNLGHMYEAAAAHYEATGEKNFLDVATKSADLLVKTFGPGKIEMPPGHPEIELGLVKLYRATGNRDYLDLAKYFVDLRGKPTDDRPKLCGEYSQDHKPLREQDEAVGHSVRAMYLYAGAADVAALTGDKSSPRRSTESGTTSSTRRRTSPAASARKGRARRSARTTSCRIAPPIAKRARTSPRATGTHRMFLLHGDAKYIDVLERALYNSVISGVSLDGKEFFYPNPLSSRGDYARSKWFDCSCCPTNLCRFIPSMPGYAYAVGDDGPYVNLVRRGQGRAGSGWQEGANRAEDELSVGRTASRSRSRRKRPATSSRCYVRIPGWARGEAWPSDLYSFLDESQRTADACASMARPLTIETGEGLCGDRAQLAAGRQGDARTCRCRCGA